MSLLLRVLFPVSLCLSLSDSLLSRVESLPVSGSRSICLFRVSPLIHLLFVCLSAPPPPSAFEQCVVGSVTSSTIISNSSVLFTFVFNVICKTESYTSIKAVGVALALAGAVAVSRLESGGRASRFGHFYLYVAPTQLVARRLFWGQVSIPVHE